MVKDWQPEDAAEASEEAGGGGAQITKPVVCVWNILRYALRNWKGKGKEHDLEKIAHYTELAWAMEGEKIPN